MVKITKAQRDYLEENGCIFGRDLHRTYGKHKTYYCTENKRSMYLLEEYEKMVKPKNY